MIRELADFEKLSHLCVSTEADLTRALFSEPARAEVIIGRENREVVCFALFFHNFSTFLGRPVCISKTCSCAPCIAAKAMGARC